jgi:hypothetical protein
MNDIGSRLFTHPSTLFSSIQPPLSLCAFLRTKYPRFTFQRRRVDWQRLQWVAGRRLIFWRPSEPSTTPPRPCRVRCRPRASLASASPSLALAPSPDLPDWGESRPLLKPDSLVLPSAHQLASVRAMPRWPRTRLLASASGTPGPRPARSGEALVSAAASD